MNSFPELYGVRTTPDPVGRQRDLFLKGCSRTWNKVVCYELVTLFMRSLLIVSVFFLVPAAVIAQQYPETLSCKSVDDIALMERLAHERLNGEERGSGASGNFDVKYYRCEWEVDPAIRFIVGKVTVYYTLLSSSVSISLDLSNGLVVDSVKQRTNVLSKQHTANLLQVNFPGTVNAGTLDSISIFYRGVPPNTGMGSFVNDMHAGVPVMWTLSEPYGSRDWWPCKNGLDDKADSIDILITNPVAYKAASNGILQHEVLVAGGTKRQSWWKHRYPIVSYLVAFAVTNYSVFNNSVQLGTVSLPVQTYCYPESQASFQANTQMVLNAMQLFHGMFGDYPFLKEKYGHVQFGWGGGMEHQTASFIVTPDEGLMAHELAHQWFGDKVTCGSWEDIWLNEGFATHLTSIYLEAKYPASIISMRRNGINSITSIPNGSVWVNDTNNVGRIFSGRLSYTKGSHLLYMLRWILGDVNFFKALQNYLKDPSLSYGFARTADLQRHLEQVSGRKLDGFFADWFKGEGHPSYNVEWSPLGSRYVKIRMNQSTSHSSVSFFELPVALQFRNATMSKTIVVDNKVNGEQFFREIGFVPDTVIIDPEYWLITRNNSSRKIIEPAGGPTSVQVFPNPVRDRFYVYLRNFNGPLRVSLYNSIGQLIEYKTPVLVNGSDFLEWDSQWLPAGVYTLVVRTGDGSAISKKLLK